MFEFAHIWILLALPLPFLVRRYFPPASVQSYFALRVPFFEAVKKMGRSSLGDARSPISIFHQKTAYFIWILLVISAAAPQWLGPPLTLPRAGRDIMLALDLSGSMEISDMSLKGMPASRLDVVKQVAKEFV